MPRPRVRRILTALIATLAVVSVLLAELARWLQALLIVLIPLIAVHGSRRSAPPTRIVFLDAGRLQVTSSHGGARTGPLEPLYVSRFYCAFRLHDPASGRRRYGLFFDETDAETWRRLRVALKAR